MVHLRHMDEITALGSSRRAVLPRKCLQLLRITPLDGFAINGEVCGARVQVMQSI